jgi:hypothetical protein
MNYSKIHGQKNWAHIEAEGCIVNIREGLHDIEGQKVTHIEIIPDDYAGEKPWIVDGSRNIRVIQKERRIN